MRQFILYALAVCSTGAFAVDFVGLGQHQSLTVSMYEVRGVKEKHRQSLYVKVIVQRDNQSFDIFCDRSGTTSPLRQESVLSCSKQTKTVGDDDNESLSFDLVRIVADGESPTFKLRNIHYSGDLTFMRQELFVLIGLDRVGKDQKTGGYVIDLELASQGRQTEWDAARIMHLGVEPLLLRRALVEERGVRLEVPVKSFGYQIDERMNVRAQAHLDTRGYEVIVPPDRIDFQLSILNRAGDLDSGYRDPNNLASDLRRMLKIKVRQP